MIKKNLLVVGFVILAGVAVWYLVSSLISSPLPFPSPTPTPTQEIEPEETEEGTIKVKKDGKFSIVLDSNFSTGYKWVFDYDSSYVELVDKKFWHPPRPSGFVGGGESGTYIFQALKSGKTQIIANYLRPWEKVPPDEVRKYQIIID